MEIASSYPHLFASQTWGTIQAAFELREEAPSDSKVANVNMVPFVGEKCVILKLENGDWGIPGGTLEPGETSLQAIRRELREEAGADLRSFVAFGAWNCHSSAEKPYRPHQPHPDFFRLVGYGDIEITGLPTNPPDGETVVAVDCIPVEEAARRFRDQRRPELADLYRMAAFSRFQGEKL